MSVCATLLDSCVFDPAPVRDLFLQLALTACADPLIPRATLMSSRSSGHIPERRIHMIWLFRKLRAVRGRLVRWTSYSEFEPGTRFPLCYHLRRLLRRKYGCIPCYVRSASGAKHYLSKDPIDDCVLEDMLGPFKELYFPALPEEVREELESGGVVLDIGAYNGHWAAEMLVQYPATKGILVEPNPEKCRNITHTLQASGVASRAKVVPAGLADTTGHAWLVEDESGSWGNWLNTSAALATQTKVASTVSTVTLEEALAGTAPVVVKCNGEGAEFEFVRQALTLDLRPKLILLMVHPERGDADTLRDALNSAGYRITVALDHATRPCWHCQLVFSASGTTLAP